MPTAFPDDVLRRIRDLEQRAGQQLTPPASVPFFVGSPSDGQILVYNATTQQWNAVSLSADATIVNTGVVTLASVITAGGPIGSSTVVPVITYDAKGRLTAVTTATISNGFPISDNNGAVTRSIVASSTSITMEADDNSSAYEALVVADANEAGTLATASLQGSTPTHTGHLQMLIAEATGPRLRLLSNSDVIDVFVRNGDPNGSVSAAYAGSLCVDVSKKQIWIAEATGASNWLPLSQELYAANATATGTVTVNFKAARVHRLTLTGNITTLTLTAPLSGWAAKLTLYLVQGGAGSFTVTWPASVKWPGGAAPTLSTAVGAVDKVELETFDGGTTWYANTVGLAFA